MQEQVVQRPVPPCYKDGSDCPKRALGCRVGCNPWQDYEQQLANYHEHQNKLSEQRNACYREGRTKHGQR